MAKRHTQTEQRYHSSAARATAAVSDTMPGVGRSVETPTLSAKTRAMIEGIREQFSTFVDDFTALVSSSRAELAPRVMRAFDAYKNETDGTFVDFVRQLDATVPADRVKYRAHRSYQAADYLRRLVAQAPRAMARKRGPRPATPLVALARLIATVLPAVDPTGQVWAAFVKEMHWTAEQAKRLQKLAASQGAVVLPKATVLRLAS